MIIRGEDSKAITSRISQRVQSNYKETMRLVQTEHSYIMSQANIMTYKELEVERYEFLATLDEKTCKICGEKDGKNFPVNEAQAGENQAPMHPNCRCTEIIYYDDEDDGQRFARLKNGKKIDVPAKMKYEEFKKLYLD